MSGFKVGHRVRVFVADVAAAGVIIRDRATYSPGYKLGEMRYKIELTHPPELSGKTVWRCDPLEVAHGVPAWGDILEHID